MRQKPRNPETNANTVGREANLLPEQQKKRPASLQCVTKRYIALSARKHHGFPVSRHSAEHDLCGRVVGRLRPVQGHGKPRRLFPPFASDIPPSENAPTL